MNVINICGVRVSAVNILMACGIIEGWIKEKKKAYICVAPVSTIVDCQKDQSYQNIVNKADMVTPDGMPTVWLGKLAGNKDIQRTYGPDLMLALCAQSEEKGYRHYIYGGTEKTCQLLENVLKSKFPRLQIVGKYSPPFHPAFVPETDSILNEINRLNPDILWIGLGSPKQDYWMNFHRPKLNVPVMLGVGAAFDFLSGAKKQAPRWMQQSGLEWFFRLCSEPRRLWKRYLIGNALFIFYLIKHAISKQSHA